VWGGGRIKCMYNSNILLEVIKHRELQSMLSHTLP
jgi:hypothetical protein